jgi:hypothetical protein
LLLAFLPSELTETKRGGCDIMHINSSAISAIFDVRDIEVTKYETAFYASLITLCVITTYKKNKMFQNSSYNKY